MREVEVDAGRHGIRSLGQAPQRAWHGRQAGILELAGETRPAEDEGPPRRTGQVCQRQGGPPGRGQDTVRVRRRSHAQQPLEVLRAVPARVVGDIDDDVAGRLAPGEELGHARHRLRATVDDTIQIDEKEHAPMVATRSLRG